MIIGNVMYGKTGEIKSSSVKKKSKEEILPSEDKDICNISSLCQKAISPEKDIKEESSCKDEENKSASSKGANNPTCITILDNESVCEKKINQQEFLQDFLSKIGPLAQRQYIQNISTTGGKIPSVSELNDEFKKFASDKSFAFEYINDGCYARAHVMCEEMMKDGINCAKMFVLTPDSFSEMVEDWNNLLVGGEKFTTENKFMKAEWTYHVAPLVFALDPATGKTEGYIMDPSLSDNPLKADEWVKKYWPGDFKINIDITPPVQYMDLDYKINKTFEESLPEAKKSLKELSGKMEEIKVKYASDHPDEKMDG